MWKMFSAYWNYMNLFDYGIWILGVLIICRGWSLCAARTNKKWAHDKEEYGKKCERVFMFTQILPLLGLLGTVLALLVTFKGFDGAEIDPGKIISDFAPALTTTASGIITLVLCILLVHLPLHNRLSSLKNQENNTHADI